MKINKQKITYIIKESIHIMCLGLMPVVPLIVYWLFGGKL